MAIASGAFCEAAFCALPDSLTPAMASDGLTTIVSDLDVATSNPFFDFVADENRQTLYAIEMRPYVLATQTTALLTAATRDFVTFNTDSPANTPFIGTVLTPIRLDQSMEGAVGFSGLSVAWGEVELSNADGDYDNIIFTHVADGRQITMKMGEIVGRVVKPYATFFQIAQLSMVDFDVDLTGLRVSVRDKSYLLEVPVQSLTYAGTGDTEGPPELLGKRKPWPLGVVNNITPAPVIPAELVYQVSWRAVSAIDDVYDGGLALSFHADYATVGDLRAATLPSGTYGTCVTEGYIRLASAPAKQVTCDVRGDNVGSYVNTTSGLVERILLTAQGGILLLADLDTASFDILDGVQPAPVGYYIGTESDETIAEVVRRLLSGISASGGFNRAGQFYVVRFDAAATVTEANYDETFMTSFVREALPSSVNPPPKRWRVAWARNWTVQTDVIEGLVEVDPNRAAYLAAPYNLVSTPDSYVAQIAAIYPRAQDVEPIESYFADEGDAIAEELRLRNLYSPLTPRSLYRIKVKFRLFAHMLNETVFLDTPRLLPSAAGVRGRVVAVKDDVERNETELVLFV